MQNHATLGEGGGGGGGGRGMGAWEHAPPEGLKCTCSEVASGGFWSPINEL